MFILFFKKIILDPSHDETSICLISYQLCDTNTLVFISILQN